MASNTHTLLDVVNIVGFRVGDIKDRFATLEQADPATAHLVYCINAALRQMARVKGLRQEASYNIINTVDPYITGTASIALGGTTVTGTPGDPPVWTAGMAGRAFAVDSDGTEYRIATWTDATHIELDKAWVGPVVTDEAYKIVQDRYSTSATFSDINYAAYDGPSTGDISIRSPSEFARQRFTMRSATLTTGKPLHVTVFSKDSSSNWEIQLDPFPDDEYRITLYTQDVPDKLSAASDGGTSMPVDDENIDTLIQGAVAMWQDKDQPGRFQAWVQSDLAFFVAMDTKSTDERVRVTPDDPTRVQNSMGVRQLPRDLDFLNR